MIMKQVSLFFLLLMACAQPRKETAAAAPSKGLPAFMMTLTSGEQQMSNSLPGNLILIFYNPDCDHCQREAKEIGERLDLFRKYSLYFIAASPMERIKQFAMEYKLAGQSNVVFAAAAVPDVVREMGPMGTPCMFIYSQEKELKKKFDGETPIEEIAKAL